MQQNTTSDTDEAQFSRLYTQHYARVASYAARRIDADTARDVAAETFLVAWRRLSAIPADAACRG